MSEQLITYLRGSSPSNEFGVWIDLSDCNKCHILIFNLVSDPAQALPMPRETYLPTGMRGLITCPLLANPPLLHVDWTKDGAPLDVTLVTRTALDRAGLGVDSGPRHAAKRWAGTHCVCTL